MLKIIDWNLNGLRSHYEDLRHLINEQRPQIVCIQETKLHPACPLTMRGFDVFRRDNINDGHASGGVVILSDAAICATTVNIRSPLQAICIAIRVPLKLTICSLYVPPSPFVLTRDDLTDLVSQLPQPYLLVGDFNAHHRTWGSNNCSPRGEMIVRVCDDLNSVILNDGSPTYLCPRTGSWSALDLALADPTIFHRFDWEILPDLFGSDHAPMKATVRGSGTVTARRPRWIIPKANWNKYAEDFLVPDVSYPVDIEACVERLTLSIQSSARDSIPKSSSSPRRQNVAWWNEDCSKALRERRKALRRFERIPSSANLEDYRLKRAIARRVFKTSRRASWQDFTGKLSRTTPSSDVWRRLRALCGKPPEQPIIGLVVNDNITNNLQEVTNILASSFAAVSKTSSYCREFQRVKTLREYHPINFQINTVSPLNTDFTSMELASALSCGKNSAPGPDDIHYAMLKNLPFEGKRALLSLYNRIFVERKFPSPWRISHVVPLYKPGQARSDPSSYRPISLTSCLCKILERMVNRRLVWFLEHNGLLSPHQAGFRQGRSTVDHLVTLETSILDAFIERRHLVAVFFDLKKAYDTAWRRGIIDTLASWGVGGNILAFVDGFLNDREFQVRLGNTLSSLTVQENGVPQGSVLSCTLFAVAINGITSCVQHPVNCSLFVDDFAVFVSARRIAAAERVLQLNIRRLEEWSKTTGFSFSPSKTQCVTFSRRRNVEEVILNLYGQPIPVSTSVKFLGITFDSRLTWVPHLKGLRSKCAKRLNILRAVSGTGWGADRTTMLRFYKAYVRSCLDYGCQAYSSARPTALRMLDPIHNSAIRLATGAFRSSPVVSLLAESGEPPLSVRRSQLICNYLFTLKSRPDVPTHNLLFQHRLTDRYNLRPNAPASFSVRAGNILSDLGIRQIPVQQYHSPDIPPWIVLPFSTNLSLSKFTKHSTPDAVFVNYFREILCSLGPCDVVYTDGSRAENGTGCAFVTANREYMFRIPPEASVYTAELTAIYKALRNV